MDATGVYISAADGLILSQDPSSVHEEQEYMSKRGVEESMEEKR